MFEKKEEVTKREQDTGYNQTKLVDKHAKTYLHYIQYPFDDVNGSQQHQRQPTTSIGTVGL